VILSIIATIISSIALIGVALGLVFQAGQLRASQLQAARSLHVELIKFAIEDPLMVTAIEGDFDPVDAPKAGYLNLLFIFLRTSYSLKAISKTAVSNQARRIFAAEYPRTWWAVTGNTYRIEAATKREKAFAQLVEVEYQNVMRSLQGQSQSGN
jgi:hypothetical protein